MADPVKHQRLENREEEYQQDWMEARGVERKKTRATLVSGQ
jgi:hypothetical protein